MTISIETKKRVVTIVVKTQKCKEGKYIIMPILLFVKEKPRKKDDGTNVTKKLFVKEKPRKKDDGTNVTKKLFVFGWLKRYVEIELTTEKPVVAQKD